MGSSTWLLGCLLLVPSLALAENDAPTPTPGRAPIGSLVSDARPGGVILARRITGSSGTAPDGTVALAASRYIYLNKNGATLNPGGTDNSRNNVSTIVPGTRAFPAWSVSAGDWAAVRGALQEMFAPFGVTVSDQAPPAGTRFIMAMFGGSAGDALPASEVPPPSQGYILGVSPFTIDCGVIEDSIVFTFAADAAMIGLSPRQIAEVAAQEIAHSYGLDHALNASDPMTYLDYSGNRSFKAGAVSCGEYSARQCGLVQQGYPSCRPNQDSVGLLTERIGTGGGPPGDTTPPTLAITAPANNAIVPPGFTVYASADDDTAITSVELYVDGVLADTASAAPYQLTAPGGLGSGDHEVVVVASDGIQDTSETITVTVDENADPVDPPDPTDPGPDGGGDYVTGGCNAGHGAGGMLGLALVGLALTVRRRRRA